MQAKQNYLWVEAISTMLKHSLVLFSQLVIPVCTRRIQEEISLLLVFM